jgi:hypothetical protein
MYRRDFLKLSGLLSAAFIMPFNTWGRPGSLPVEVEAQGKLFRGTPDGKIYVSTNEGRSWQLHTNLGPQMAILGLVVHHKDQIRAQLGFANHTFELALAQKSQAWMTV